MNDAARAALPLCVDMDGTLVATDTLWESLLTCARTKPAALLQLPVWLLRGRPALKAKLYELAPLQAETLPYREEVVRYVEQSHASGRRVVLATASHRAVAEAVAQHLGLFHEVLGSEGASNLKGSRKRDALVSRFGRGGFEYLGDARADWPVWQASGAASSVGLSAPARSRLASLAPAGRHFDRAPSGVGTWLRALRVRQWVKNALLFAPVVAGHHLTDLAALTIASLAFVAFSLAASAVYVLNDLLDLAADRAHPTKRTRPFATGALSLGGGVLAIPLLLLASLGLSLALLPPSFSALLALYLGLNLAYSLRLKRVVVADVILLASLYSLRVLAGGFATAIEVSPWLLEFSLFFFVNLALLKRYADLQVLAAAGACAAPGRGYRVSDAGVLLALGSASGYLAALVFVLYVQSDRVATLYSEPRILWGAVPLLLYWISRLWVLAQRGEVGDDPIEFTVRDPVSYGVFAGILGVLALAAAVQL